LRQALGKFNECHAIHFKDTNGAYHLQDEVDAIVSGSAARIVDPFHQVMFQGLASFIKNCELPLLGICYGHQLIC
jgi:GMP synthase-like glutamine amidotransferase